MKIDPVNFTSTDVEIMSGEEDKGNSTTEPGLTMAEGDVESSDEEINTKQSKKDSNDKVPKDEPSESGATSQETSSGGGWWAGGSASSWSGWYESALNKSSAAYDLMKKDLSEFKDTIANESANVMNSTSNVMSSTVQVVSSTANYIKETVESLVDEEEEKNDDGTEKDAQTDGKDMKDSTGSNEQEFNYPESLTIAAADKLTSVFNSLIESLLPTGPDDDPDEDCVLLPGNYLVPKSRWDRLVQSIQSDPITYCHEPNGPPDDYESWLEKFNLMDHESSITYLLESSAMVADFYAQFVPKSLSSDEFWHRYFYRLHQLQEMEIQRAKLLYEKNAVRKEDSTDPVVDGSKIGSSNVDGTNVEEKKEVNEPVMKKSDSKSSLKAIAEPPSKDGSTPKKSPLKTSNKLGAKVPSSASSVKSTSSVKSDKSNKNSSKVSKAPGKTPSPASSESTAKSSSEGSEWEKTDLNEIVDEVAKKLGDKLNSMPEPRSDEEEMDQWEFE